MGNAGGVGDDAIPDAVGNVAGADGGADGGGDGTRRIPEQETTTSIDRGDDGVWK